MENNPALNSLQTISSTINEQEQALWIKEARIKSIKSASKILQQKIQNLDNHISKTDKETNSIKNEMELLQKCYDTLEYSFESDLLSITYHSLYLKSIEKELDEYKLRCKTVNQEYTEFYNKEEARLQAENPLYRELKTKQAQLKYEIFTIKGLKKTIEKQKKKNALKQDFANKLLYSNVVNFAKAWLNQREFEKSVEELKIAKEKERRAVTELLELQEKAKRENRRSYVMKPTILNFENLSGEEKQLNTSNTTEVSEEPNIPPKLSIVLDLKNAYSILNEPDQNAEKIRKEFSQEHDKVRILEDIVMRPPPPPTPTQNKQNRVKKATQKLKSFVKQLSNSSVENIFKPTKLSQMDKTKDSAKCDLNQSVDSVNSTLELCQQMNKSKDTSIQEKMNRSQSAYNGGMPHFMPQQMQQNHSAPVQNNFSFVPEQPKMMFQQSNNVAPKFSFANGARKELEARADNGPAAFQSQFLSRNNQSVPTQNSFFNQSTKAPIQNQFEARQVPNSTIQMDVDYNKGQEFLMHQNGFQMNMMNEQRFGNIGQNSIAENCPTEPQYYENSDSSFDMPQFSPVGNMDNNYDTPSFLPFQSSNDIPTGQSFNFGSSNNRNLF